jgi:hypothetical protein
MSEEFIESGSVEFPQGWFSNTKLDYNNWVQAWFREALQNSIDAKSKNIDFKIAFDPEKPESVTVECQDDGVGMDSRVLFKVFLSLGGSEKAEGAIGGFGHAKLLLAFAHMNYEIETNNIRVKGSGAKFDSFKAETAPGVRLKVEMSTKDVNPSRLSSELHNIVHHSSFANDVKITLNGEELLRKPQNHPYHKETVLGNLTFKDLPHGYNSSTLWVRINGLAMFSAGLWSHGSTGFDGYLDLVGNSKDLVTSNRDALTRDQSRVLNEILQTLANDREKLKLSGNIDVLLNERDLRLSDFSSHYQEQISTESSKQNLSPEEFLARLVASADENGDEYEKNPFRSLVDGILDLKKKKDSAIEEIPSNWYPDNFKIKFADSGVSQEDTPKHAKNIAVTMSKKRTGKLAAGWNRVVKTLLDNETYRNMLGVSKAGNGEFYYGEKLIQTGFVFGSPAGLNENERNQDRISIMMNPDYVIENDYKFGDLVALAQHELTHIAIDSHYESFTTKEFELRRVARNQIGMKVLENAYLEALADWRNEHSGTKVEKRESVRQCTRDEEDSYGMH